MAKSITQHINRCSSCSRQLLWVNLFIFNHLGVYNVKSEFYKTRDWI